MTELPRRGTCCRFGPHRPNVFLAVWILEIGPVVAAVMPRRQIHSDKIVVIVTRQWVAWSGTVEAVKNKIKLKNEIHKPNWWRLPLPSPRPPLRHPALVKMEGAAAET